MWQHALEVPFRNVVQMVAGDSNELFLPRIKSQRNHEIVKHMSNKPLLCWESQLVDTSLLVAGRRGWFHGFAGYFKKSYANAAESEAGRTNLLRYLAR